ncbi:hypothetical protein [Propionicimonas sp.]|uniref:hypothetical protein n=1 Tax=Propionicimonas sp. TaxID=1955623 RepID=UPI001D4307DB|nr:hypothetical protein [Propionicimonas sp.]MBU3977251.1 hypothetical protein [Actinomycetota bacterium]MBU3985761.1 hypothetical protein [Actinomycetota bacterium]MBU4008546.1 hypothetical protein [Actinomycetota bacterium]MBU4066304.1 hypothetical protein [Actinomycetota bacterium]MBU4093752.1 hypothetical protein [Actinomycetota bacterium]
MLSYSVTDRDRERLAEDLDIARMIEPTPIHPRRFDRRHWFRKAMTEGESIRTHLASV